MIDVNKTWMPTGFYHVMLRPGMDLTKPLRSGSVTLLSKKLYAKNWQQNAMPVFTADVLTRRRLKIFKLSYIQYCEKKKKKKIYGI